MPEPATVTDQNGNRLIGGLLRQDRQRLLSKMERIDLEPKQVLYRPDEPIRQVYFPLDGVHPMISTVEEDHMLEVGTVGKEGMAGIPVFLGANQIPFLVFAEVPGGALRVESADFWKEIK